MATEKKYGRLTFEESLQRLGVKKAFDVLVRKKVDAKRLKFWLRDIATAPDKYEKRKKNGRRAAQLARSARSMANKIERAKESPPILFMGRATELQALLALERNLPNHLREYASGWERLIDWENVRSRRTPRGPSSPRTDRIWALLETVKERTGSYHYREIADLLNVFGMAFGRGKGGTHWNETNLRQLQYRARNRMAKLLKD